MPRISAFYGIVIAMYFGDHLPPHLHARYGRHEAQVAILTGDVLHGGLPHRALALVGEWTELHREAARRLGARRARRARRAAGQHRATAMSARYEITAVEHLGGHRLLLTFADGLVGDIDLSDRFAHPVGPVFEPLQDTDDFAMIEVDAELGTVVWPNGADLAPDLLHQQVLNLA